MQNENEIQTATDNHVSIIEDLKLTGAIATQVQGGFDAQGRLFVGTDQGVYRNCAGHGTFTLTFQGQTTLP